MEDPGISFSFMTIKQTPQFHSAPIPYKGKVFQIEYFLRPGSKETIIMLHGLGGCKENYYEACKSDELSDYTLVSFDNPGTGNSTYFEDMPLNVDDLTAISALFIDHLNAGRFILCGTSMGGLTTLLYLKHHAKDNVIAYINIEGNLMREDCMFSSKVVTYDRNTFIKEIYPKTIRDMKTYSNAGYYIVANNLQLNTNIISYYNYSFQTVKYSTTGELLEQFLQIGIPKIFIHGNKNRSLSYIPKLRENNVNVKEISGSDHFVFYDNPKELYEVIGEFCRAAGS